jgi:hypothetical protein
MGHCLVQHVGPAHRYVSANTANSLSCIQLDSDMPGTSHGPLPQVQVHVSITVASLWHVQELAMQHCQRHVHNAIHIKDYTGSSQQVSGSTISPKVSHLGYHNPNHQEI